MDIRKVLIEGVIQDLITFLCEDKSLSITDSMQLVYNSMTYTKLCDETTGLYRESSAYVYEYLKDEIQDGCLKQKEI